MNAEQLKMASAETDLVATALRSGGAYAKAALLDSLVRQVRLDEDQIEVELDRDALRERLGIGAEPKPITESLTLKIPAVRVRRGHQLRLIVPGPENPRLQRVRRDEKLIALMANAYQARELILASPEHSLARIARQHGRCRTRLGRLVELSCLAPDIIRAVVEGKQPEHLTVSRLMSKPLSLAWSQQRRELDVS